MESVQTELSLSLSSDRISRISSVEFAHNELCPSLEAHGVVLVSAVLSESLIWLLLTSPPFNGVKQDAF